jgi:arylsulfatase A-like enzyme
MKRFRKETGMCKWRFFFLLTSLWFAAGCSDPGEEKQAEVEVLPPNIVVILIDDAGFSDFGFQGETDLSTPNIDQLASGGVIFNDAHVTATVCSPSRAGLLTGRCQQRFGYESNSPPEEQGLESSETTIASLLKKQGYKTGAFGKWHLGLQPEHHPNNRGFDEFFGFLSGSRSYFPSPLQDRPGSPRAIMSNREYVSFDGYLTDILAARATDFMEANKSEPFFVYLSFNAVHTPMEATQDDMERFSGHPRQTLAAMTWALDRAVGNVLGKLDELGIRENTLVFFLSDNGGSAFNNSRNTPLKGWKGNKFEGGHRVPFVLSWPGKLEGGGTFFGLSSSLDIAATALSCAFPEGNMVSVPRPLDGVNLIPFLLAGKQGDPHEFLCWRKEDVAAVRMGDWKLIRLDDFDPVLYNLADNLGETMDKSELNPEVLAAMSAVLDNWESEMKEPRWHEDAEWIRVTRNIHEALLKNKEPGRISP